MLTQAVDLGFVRSPLWGSATNLVRKTEPEMSKLENLQGKTVSGTLSGASWVPHCIVQSELRNRLGRHFAEPYGLRVFMA
jgi:hypothetical protein